MNPKKKKKMENCFKKDKNNILNFNFVYKSFWGWAWTSRPVYWPQSPAHREKKGKSMYYYNANVYALEICAFKMIKKLFWYEFAKF